MVSFSTLPYSKAIDRWHRQTHWLNVAMVSTTVITATAAATFVGLRYRDQLLNSFGHIVDSIKKSRQ
ncbi:hypothetical protein G6F42_017369 [Rhizopus arrhizus]|nr:hypothetical protein G6F42_017369 [Rhizopus arrhizus]